MEVHHHPEIEKKNFKQYFLEFLMIFLAVTMGFFAEQIREYFADKSREREYMQELVENLKYDTVRCVGNTATNVIMLRGLDSLSTELKKAIRGNINSNALYYFSHYTGSPGQAIFNTSAITELKSSGSIRIISNKKLVVEMADYYERKISATNSYVPNTTDVTNLQNNIFSFLELDDYVKSYDTINAATYDIDYNYQLILNRQPELKLLAKDPLTLEKYYTQVSLLAIAVKRYDFWLLYCRNAAVELIAAINKEYHLDQ